MNLSELTSGTTTTKPWLAIVAESVNANSLLVNGNPVSAGNAILLGSAGGVSLVADGVGPSLETKGLTAGAGVTLTPSPTDVTITIPACLKLDGTTAMLGDIDAGGFDIVNGRNITLSGKGYLGGSRPMMSGGYSMITNTQVGPSSTVETNIIGAGVGTLTIPANSLTAGDAFRLDFSGSVNIGPGTQTVTIRLYGGLAGATLWGTCVYALQTLTGTPPPWRISATLTCKSIGAGGTIQCNAHFAVNDASPTQIFVTQTLAAIDTTIANTLRMTAQWAASNPANVFITNQLSTNTVYVI